MTRLISSSAISACNISSSLMTGSYAASADQELTVRLFVDKVTGACNYIAQLYLQPSACTNFFPVVPYTSASVDASASRFGLVTIPFKMGNGDGLKVYITGACADTASPNILTEIWEQWGTGAISASNFAASAIDNTVFAANSGSVVWNAAVRSVTDKAGFSLAASGFAASNIAGSALDETTLAAAFANAVADALLDRANGVETSYTPRKAWRLILSALAGKVSGASTTTITIRDIGDSVDRIVATVDAYGDRSAITYTAS